MMMTGNNKEEEQQRRAAARTSQVVVVTCTLLVSRVVFKTASGTHKRGCVLVNTVTIKKGKSGHVIHCQTSLRHCSRTTQPSSRVGVLLLQYWHERPNELSSFDVQSTSTIMPKTMNYAIQEINIAAFHNIAYSFLVSFIQSVA